MLGSDRAFRSATFDLGAGLALRTLSAADVRPLAAMVAAQDPWVSYPITAEQLARFLAEVEPGAPRFKVEHEGSAAGVLVVRTNWFRGPYIQLLALDPTHHSRGIGGRLIAFVEMEARRWQERNLWVAASYTNHGALRFYERHGFVRTAAIDGLVRDDRTEILLRKRLPS
jgi:GNAT superfamily N-acetyltransferase